MVVLDLDELVSTCQRVVAEQDRAAGLREVLDRIAADPAGARAALGEPGAGGLRTIHHAPDLTILNVVWTPGMSIEPHDHRMLAGIAVYGGREDNAFFRRRGDDRVEAAGGRRLVEGDVLVLGTDAIHGVTADPARYTGAIHIYSGDFFDRERTVWDAANGCVVPDPPPVADVFAEAERRWQRHGAAVTC